MAYPPLTAYLGGPTTGQPATRTLHSLPSAMLKTFLVSTTLGLLAACQPQPAATTDQPAPPTVPAPPTPPAASCYAYTAQDTVYLTLAGPAAATTGNLIYHYAGKDRNRGTIRGAFSGDTLRAEYTFQSEGTESVREVAFVRRGPGFTEGYGPVTERNGKTVFQQPHQLKFDNRITLAPVACK